MIAKRKRSIGEEQNDNLLDLDSSFEHETAFAYETELMLPRDLITPTSSTALRIGLSTRQHTVMLAPFVNTVSGIKNTPLSNVTLSVGRVFGTKKIEKN